MPALVSIWMERGTLHDFMKTFPRGDIEACVMVNLFIPPTSPLILLPRSFSFTTSLQGLAYLHSKEVVHAGFEKCSYRLQIF